MLAEPAMRGIDVVIPNWNGRQMLEVCLASLHRQTYQDVSIIVVDNGSTDDSLEFLTREYPAVKVIALPENRGFSGAVNLGIAAGSREFIFLLNNDTELDRDCLGQLARTSSASAEYGVFAPKMLSFHDRTVLDGAGDGVLRGGVGYRLGTLETDGIEYSLGREVFGACAGAALYRRSLFDEIGTFDDDFFAYLEDVDFNMRAVKAGCRCYYQPAAIVYHIGSATSGSKINPLTVKLSTRNNLFVIAKNYCFSTFVRFLPVIVIYQFFWLLFVLKKRQFRAYCAGVIAAVPHIPAMVRKRAESQVEGSIPEHLFRTRIVEAERMVVRSIMSRRAQKGKANWALRAYMIIFCR